MDEEVGTKGSLTPEAEDLDSPPGERLYVGRLGLAIQSM